MFLTPLLGAGLLTLTSGAPAADPFAVKGVTLTAAAPAFKGRPFGLSFSRPLVRKPWRQREAPPSAHRADEQGAVIRTEDGVVHCEGHLFHADRAATAK